MNPLKSPLFIIGCPRSGTTLLSSLLKLTQYGTPVETHFITKYYKRLDKYHFLTDEKDRLNLVQDILKERPVRQWKLDINPEDFVANLPSDDYGEIVNRLCFFRFHKLGYASWGDKTPHYILDLKILYKLFPESKYLYIVRDGRDVALSLLKKPWGPNTVYTSAVYWKNCNSATETIQEIERNGQLHKIKYEDLLKNPDKEIFEMISFIGESELGYKILDLTDSIQRDNFDKWKRQMPLSEIALFENVASDVLVANGYSVVHPKKIIPVQVRFKSILIDRLKYFAFLAKLNILDTILIKFFGKEPFAE